MRTRLSRRELLGSAIGVSVLARRGLEGAPPQPTELFKMSASELARAIATRKVSTEPPFRVGRDTEGADASWEISRSMRLVVIANLLGLPAAVVPVGAANGLPQAVQVLGPLYREDLCLGAAQAIEDRRGTITPIA